MSCLINLTTWIYNFNQEIKSDQHCSVVPEPQGQVQVRSLLRSHSQGERSRASLAPGLYHPSPSIFSPSWSDRQGAVDDGAITGLRTRRSSAVRRPTPCHFSSLSSLLVHSSLFFWPSPPTVKFAGRSLWTTIISTILCTGVKEDSTIFPHVLVVADSSRLSFLFFSNLASLRGLLFYFHLSRCG